VIASRRGEGRGNKLMSKTGYIKIALRPVTVARSCLLYESNCSHMVLRVPLDQDQ
jgi:hypothetical protein